MTKRLLAAVASWTLASSPAWAANLTLTSTQGGALFEGTFNSTYPNTTFDFSASLVGPLSGLPVSFSVQFVGQATYDNRFCDPLSSGPMGCGVFSDFSGPTEAFTLSSAVGNFTYNLPGGFNMLRGNLAFSNTSGATVVVNGPGSAVPEPASWVMMVGGFAMACAALRQRRRSCRAEA